MLNTTLCDKFVSDLWQIYGFLWVLWFSLGTMVFSTIKTDHHDITEISLKLLLTTITLAHSNYSEILLMYRIANVISWFESVFYLLIICILSINYLYFIY